MPLTDVRVRNAKAGDKAYKLQDGAGMYVLVTPGGARYWRLDYRFAGKRRTIALGVYPTVSLSRARVLREAARTLVAANVDPGLDKKAKKRAVKQSSETTFEAVAREWIFANRRNLSPRYHALLLARLEQDIFPQIGGRP